MRQAPIVRCNAPKEAMSRHATTRIRAIVGGALAALLVSGSVAAAVQAAHAAPLPTIVINEVESNGGTPVDGVELYNTGTETVDVGGYIFMDSEPRMKAIPAGTTIAPGEYSKFVVDENLYKVGLGGADCARLFLPDGTTLVDGTSWGPDHAKYTWGRCPDGTSAFAETTASTPGAANACPDASAALKINEVVSDGGTPGDWIKFVNTGDVPVDAGGLVVRDNDVANPYTIPAGTWVAVGGYLVVDNGANFLYGLGKGDSVRHYCTDGTTLLDSTTWPSGTYASPSWGRCPDASGNFAITQSATKGAAHECVPLGGAEEARRGERDRRERIGHPRQRHRTHHRALRRVSRSRYCSWAWAACSWRPAWLGAERPLVPNTEPQAPRTSGNASRCA